MAALEGVESGTVTWRILAATQDTNDDDREPNLGSFRGAVLFTPSRNSVRRLLPTPYTIFLDPVLGNVGDDGILRDLSGLEGVVLVSPYATGLEETGWEWSASFQLNQREKVSFPFRFQPGETVDLSRVTPVLSTPGVVFTKGDPGPGVAVGGATGQVLAKKSEVDYDTEWVTFTGGEGGGGTGVIPDASTTTKGILRIGGDLGGTADNPTVPNKVQSTPGEILAIRRMTQAAYDTLTPKSSTTLYVIVG